MPAPNPEKVCYLQRLRERLFAIVQDNTVYTLSNTELLDMAFRNDPTIVSNRKAHMHHQREKH